MDILETGNSKNKNAEEDCDIVVLDAPQGGNTYNVSAGADRILLVAYINENVTTGSIDLTSLDYGGRPMALINSENITNGTTVFQHVSFWYMLNADLVLAAGNNIVANYVGGIAPSRGELIYSVSFDNVNQANPLFDTDSQQVDNSGGPVFTLNNSVGTANPGASIVMDGLGGVAGYVRTYTAPGYTFFPPLIDTVTNQFELGIGYNINSGNANDPVQLDVTTDLFRAAMISVHLNGCEAGSTGTVSSVIDKNPDGREIACHDNGDGTVISIKETVNPYLRSDITAQVINNVGAALNTISYSAPTIISKPTEFTVAGSNITFNKAGDYKVAAVVDYFDNNSARVAHRAIFRINGVEVSRLSGANYMRDANGQDEASTHYEDFITVGVGDVLTIDIQNQTTVGGTTDLTASSRILIEGLG